MAKFSSAKGAASFNQEPGAARYHTFHYRTNSGAVGSVQRAYDKSDLALQRAFNEVAEKMIKEGWLRGPVGDRVRVEGKMTGENGSKGRAIHQGDLVVANVPVPSSFEIKP